MSIPACSFTLFPKLPTELREEIWRYCLPQRVCELTLPIDDIVFDGPGKIDGPWPCELFHTTRMNGIPPVITHVCHESRSVAFKAGSIRPETWDFTGRPLEARWKGLDTSRTWQDCSRDLVHLNWTSACQAEYDYTRERNPLEYLAWEAVNFSHGGSLMVDYLDESFGLPDPFEDLDLRAPTGPVEPSKLTDLEILSRFQKWRVVMRVIVVHSDPRTAAETGLFGLLGDARVQIFDVSDQTRIEALFDFAEKCERQNPVTIAQNFHRESTDAVEQKLKTVIIEQFQSEELAAAMRPAVMFRLCTRMCNHTEYEDRSQGRFRHDGSGYGLHRDLAEHG